MKRARNGNTVMNARDRRGRFAAGNPGGPGRPRRVIEAEYLSALTDAVTLDDWRDISFRAVRDAKNGDAPARAWLAKYLMPDGPGGLPDSDVDVDPMEIARRLRELADEPDGNGRDA